MIKSVGGSITQIGRHYVILDNHFNLHAEREFCKEMIAGNYSIFTKIDYSLGMEAFQCHGNAFALTKLLGKESVKLFIGLYRINGVKDCEEFAGHSWLVIGNKVVDTWIHPSNDITFVGIDILKYIKSPNYIGLDQYFRDISWHKRTLETTEKYRKKLDKGSIDYDKKLANLLHRLQKRKR